MSGKTTLLDAWFWARYGWLPKWGGPKGGPADAVIRRGSDNKCWVEVVETIGSDEIKYKRSRPSKFQVWKNGVLQKSIKQVEFEELIGMTAQQFLICVYVPQKRKQSFYYMSDTERTELLSVIANLEKLDAGLVKAKAARDEIKAQISHAEGRLETLQATHDYYPELLKESKGKADLFHEKMVEITAEIALERARHENTTLEFEKEERRKTDNAMLKTQKKLQEIKGEKESLREEVQAYGIRQIQLAKEIGQMPELDKSYLQRVIEWRKLREKAEADNRLRESQLRENKEYAEKMTQHMDLAQDAQNGTCNACDQALPKEKRDRMMQEHIETAGRYKEKIVEPIAETQKDVLDEIEAAVSAAEQTYYEKQIEMERAPAELRKEQKEVEQKLKNISKQNASLEERERQIENAFELEVSTYVQERKTSIERDYASIHDLEKDLEMENNNYKWAIEKVRDTEEKTINVKNEITSVLTYLQQRNDDLNLQLDLIELFGPKGYRSVCFDGLVQRISERAGQLLSIMSEGLYATRIDQVGQDSKGAQKMILRPVLIKEGTEIPLDDLSGGAEARVALAYDVAVSEATGAGLPLLLDEALEGLDAVGKEGAMFLLEEVAKTRSVIIVDHASEFKAMFNQVQEIIYDNKISRLGKLTIA
jgi:DNA repair exonuclease SbcCD ATPase subunit